MIPAWYNKVYSYKKLSPYLLVFNVIFSLFFNLTHLELVRYEFIYTFAKQCKIRKVPITKGAFTKQLLQ